MRAGGKEIAVAAEGDNKRVKVKRKRKKETEKDEEPGGDGRRGGERFSDHQIHW